jgi:hypothetical protein
MAELIVRSPGEPDRVVRLDSRAVVIGRGEDCEVQIADKRSSRRHLQVAPQATGAAGRTWVATDLQSANGTFAGEDRILRRALDAGDVLRIGDTTFEFREAAPAAAAPAAAPLVSGTLVFQVPADLRAAPVRPSPGPVPVPLPGPAPARAAEAAAPATDAGGPVAARAPAERAARSRASSRSLVRAAAFVVVGIAAVAGVEVFLGGRAATTRAVSDEANRYTELLADADLPFPTLEGNFREFESAFPDSRYLPDLATYVDARRALHDREKAGLERLDELQRRFTTLPESDLRAQILAVERENRGAQRVKTRIDLMVADLDRRRDEAVARERQALDVEVDKALARNDPAGALRRIAAFRAGRPLIAKEDRDRVAAREGEARGRALEMADRALADAAAAADADAKRAALVAVLPGLAGTAEEERLVTALQTGLAAGPSSAGRDASGGAAGTGGTPGAAGGLTPDLIAKVGEAEGFARGRRFDKAAAAYEAMLAAAALPPRLKKEYEERTGEMKRILSLVKDLSDAAAAAGAKPLRPKVSGNAVDLLSADGAGIRVKRKDQESTHAWSELAPSDVLALLARPRPTPDQRLALAVLAIELGERKAGVDELIALLDVPSHREQAFRVAARRLDGRATVPEGGYHVFEGELLAKAEYDRRVEARRLAGLRTEAEAIAVKVAAEPGYKRLATLAEKRAELDKRRAYALLAIFDEKHYPYPDKTPPHYPLVQREIDRRIEAVYEAWNDPFSVNVLGKGAVTRETPVGKMIERHEAICVELEGKGKDVTDLRAAMAPLALYATDEPLTVRTYFKDPDEKALLAYNKWVLEVYNPARTAWISELEREQVQITNDYRMVMGFSMNVTPGPAAFTDIDEKNVASILDAGTETGRTPLRAVRIDDRLVKAARGHSLDMGRRGFFAHTAPANPATGEPETTPFDRMQKCGYSGGGASENIAKSGGPMDAHMAWRHSSGHHRNIVSPWADLGVGMSGGNWTQNFGASGIPEIGSAPPPSPPPFEPEAPGKPPRKAR